MGWEDELASKQINDTQSVSDSYEKNRIRDLKVSGGDYLAK